MYTKEQIEGATILYNDLCTKCDVIEMAGIWEPANFRGYRLKEIMKDEVAKFLLYLSASDGRVSENEVKLFNLITGYEFDADDAIRTVSEENIYSTDFEKRIPLIINVACVAAERFMQMGVNPTSNGMTLPEQFVLLYKYIGELLIGMDGQITSSERSDFDAYINNLNNYIYS